MENTRKVGSKSLISAISKFAKPATPLLSVPTGPLRAVKGPSIKDVGSLEGGRGVPIDDMGRYDGGRGTKNPISAIQGVKNGQKLPTSFMDGPNE